VLLFLKGKKGISSLSVPLSYTSALSPYCCFCLFHFFKTPFSSICLVSTSTEQSEEEKEPPSPPSPAPNISPNLQARKGIEEYTQRVIAIHWNFILLLESSSRFQTVSAQKKGLSPLCCLWWWLQLLLLVFFSLSFECFPAKKKAL
jgi:hypothetical protein